MGRGQEGSWALRVEVEVKGIRTAQGDLYYQRVVCLYAVEVVKIMIVMMENQQFAQSREFY